MNLPSNIPCSKGHWAISFCRNQNKMCDSGKPEAVGSGPTRGFFLSRFLLNESSSFFPFFFIKSLMSSNHHR